jgi:hypothetical protein
MNTFWNLITSLRSSLFANAVKYYVFLPVAKNHCYEISSTSVSEFKTKEPSDLSWQPLFIGLNQKWKQQNFGIVMKV